MRLVRGRAGARRGESLVRGRAASEAGRFEKSSSKTCRATGGRVVRERAVAVTNARKKLVKVDESPSGMGDAGAFAARDFSSVPGRQPRSHCARRRGDRPRVGSDRYAHPRILETFEQSPGSFTVTCEANADGTATAHVRGPDVAPASLSDARRGGRRWTACSRRSRRRSGSRTSRSCRPRRTARPRARSTCGTGARAVCEKHARGVRASTRVGRRLVRL